MKTLIHKVDKIVNGILTYFVIALLSVMSVVVFAQVVFRLLHLSIPWSEELSKYLLIWTTFLGAALCVRKGSLVGLEVIYGIMPKRFAKGITIFVRILTSAFLIFLIIYGFQASVLVFKQTTPILKLSMGILYASIPVGSCFMLLNTFITSYYLLTGEEEK